MSSIYHSAGQIEIQTGMLISDFGWIIAITVMTFCKNSYTVKITKLQCALEIFL